MLLTAAPRRGGGPRTTTLASDNGHGGGGAVSVSRRSRRRLRASTASGGMAPARRDVQGGQGRWGATLATGEAAPPPTWWRHWRGAAARSGEGPVLKGVCCSRSCEPGGVAAQENMGTSSLVSDFSCDGCPRLVWFVRGYVACWRWIECRSLSCGLSVMFCLWPANAPPALLIASYPDGCTWRAFPAAAGQD